ncbi:MAG TPA: SRPBCC family protein [Steroidobacteraceae bacterium]|nr:SRPBCC family protein [Steroidobacteraceae bacterium]
MSSRDQYRPGAATGASIRRHGENWTLIVVRELRHPPEKVWEALTDPAQLREWAPYDADRSLATVGTVTLTTVGAAASASAPSEVTRAEAPWLLEYRWGGNEMRWQLEPLGTGTRLTLWHNIDRRYIAMGAAGWQICLDVLGHLLDGDPLGRIVGGDAMRFEWPRLHAEYQQQFDSG